MTKYNLDLDLIPINIAIYKRVDNDFEFVFFNKTAEKTENIEAKKIVGKKVSEIFPGIKKFGLFDVLERVYKSGKDEIFDMHFYEDDRISGWRKNYIHKLPSGEIAAFYTDHTFEKELETELLEQKTFLKTVLNVIPDLIWIKDLNFKYVACNKKFEEVYEIKEKELIGKSDYDLVDAKTAKLFIDNDKTVLASEKPVIYDEYWTLDNKNHRGYYETIKTVMRNNKGDITGILGIARDISERVKKEKELLKYALYDSLTGLANRANFLQKLENLINDRIYKDKMHALFFIDLDQFKEINDTFGHSTGDLVLIESARRLEKSIRKDDIIARLGGDEFVIVLKNIKDLYAVQHIAQKIIDIIKEPILIKNNSFHISASIGISMIPMDSRDIENLLSYADSAMYKAKEKGRSCYEFYTQDISKKAYERVVLENSLRNALENNEFVMYYQPQVDIKSAKVIGAESLIRWKHSSLGLVSPAKFIPIAEESGLILDIGKWIINQVMKDTYLLKKEGYKDINTISINLSVKQLNNKGLLNIIKDGLKRSGCDPKWIEFEITESFAMQDPKVVISVLKNLKEIGCKISIDDFGTGYSSLQYLKKFPIDKLKIDQSFIRDIPSDEDDEAIVKAVILIAKSMKLDVIAEGVEDDYQHLFLKNNKCDLIQGYLYSKPLPFEEFKNFIKNHNKR